MNNQQPEYVIDPEFRRMIYPLAKREYRELEKSMLEKGCIVPISIWKGMIVDGHNRYEICKKHNISLKAKEVHFIDRSDAIQWICINQLNRADISEEIRRYLIGKRYINEQEIEDVKPYTENMKETVNRLHTSPKSIKLGKIYSISAYTISKYGSFARAVDYVSEFFPVPVRDIVYGRIRISNDRFIEISRLPISEIKIELDRLTNVHHGKHRYTDRDETNNIVDNIKKMPQFDPDSYAMSLALTIPSWIKTISKAKDNTDIKIISPRARVQLFRALNDLKETSENFIKDLEVK